MKLRKEEKEIEALYERNALELRKPDKAILRQLKAAADNTFKKDRHAPAFTRVDGKGRDGCLHRPPAADEVFLAVGARGASELPAETAGEIKLVIEPAGVGDL